MKCIDVPTATIIIWAWESITANPVGYIRFEFKLKLVNKNANKINAEILGTGFEYYVLFINAVTLSTICILQGRISNVDTYTTDQ
jgi:hypothetical protein